MDTMGNTFTIFNLEQMSLNWYQVNSNNMQIFAL